jgi:ArsR family transcriptional regulator
LGRKINGVISDGDSLREAKESRLLMHDLGGGPVDCVPYFRYYGIMRHRKTGEQTTWYADMFAAMGAEPRLRIMQLLLAAHPQGLVVGDIQDELGIPASTLSHHLDKLKNEDLIRVRREGTFLWYTANTDSLQEILNFLYAECCSQNKAIEPGELVSIGQPSRKARERKNK